MGNDNMQQTFMVGENQGGFAEQKVCNHNLLTTTDCQHPVRKDEPSGVNRVQTMCLLYRRIVSETSKHFFATSLSDMLKSKIIRWLPVNVNVKV